MLPPTLCTLNVQGCSILKLMVKEVILYKTTLKLEEQNYLWLYHKYKRES